MEEEKWRYYVRQISVGLLATKVERWNLEHGGSLFFFSRYLGTKSKNLKC